MSSIGGIPGFSSPFVVPASTDGTRDARPAESPVLVDHLPTVATFVAQSLGIPELPAADLALMGTDGFMLLAGFLSGERRDEVVKPLLESLVSRGLSVAALEISRNAGKAFDGNLGEFMKALAEGTVKAIKNDPEGSLMLAMEIGRVVGTAVATGGGSLATDLPALAPKLMTAASAVLRESGIEIDALMTQIATDFLKSMGVEEATAQTIARVGVSLVALGADVALAIASEGKHPIPPERVANAVREIALATGVEPDTAAVVASAGAAAFAFGQNFYGYVAGGGDPAAYGGLDQIANVATDAVKTWMAQGGASADEIQSTLIRLSPLIQSFLETVQKDMSGAGEQSARGWGDLNKALLGWNPAFGDVFDGINSCSQLSA